MYCRDCKGFTLIELLVVIILLGIITSLAVFSFGISGAERKMEEEAKRLHALIKLTQEESIIQAKEIALEFDKQAYSFLEYKDKKWIPIKNKIFKKRDIPAELDFQIEAESELSVLAADKDQLLRLYFLSSGEQTPFTIKINVKNKENNYYQLSGLFNGKLAVKHIDDGDF